MPCGCAGAEGFHSEVSHAPGAQGEVRTRLGLSRTPHRTQGEFSSPRPEAQKPAHPLATWDAHARAEISNQPIPHMFGSQLHPLCFSNANLLTRQVLQSMTQEQREQLTSLKLRYKARDFALKAVKAQRDQFKRRAKFLTRHALS